MSKPLSVHANALVIGEAGILIRGRTGSGKSSLSIGLVDAARRAGRFASLVADDRTRLAVSNQCLIASPHPEISGLIELRMLGPVPQKNVPACLIALVIDLMDEEIARLPENCDREAEISGIKLARLALPARISTECALPLVLAALPQ